MLPEEHMLQNNTGDQDQATADPQEGIWRLPLTSHLSWPAAFRAIPPPVVISEDSWDLRVYIFRSLLLLPKTYREQGYYGDPGGPMLEPVSDGLLIMLSFWDKPSA